MSVSAVSSGYPILQQSSKMAGEAAHEIQQAQIHTSRASQDPALQRNSLDTPPSKKPDTVNALINLNQAQQYNRVGASVIQREQEMIGSLLDVRV
ncbi:hypothetical protein [Vibrio sp. 11986-1-5]|uniref:hypothetical protein n=1 Tax=Vibrio sp. 11986-1-5 TaxID=2211215 RepID=UPI000D73DA4F|nr:hypothetical protein [Vibrio sp. 11986-1-5]PXA73010.1 hypothetical protein DMC15_07700 [Vibrio sp. 11986-1-5]